MVMCFFIHVLYPISLQNKCPKICQNPENGLSPEKSAKIFVRLNKAVLFEVKEVLNVPLDSVGLKNLTAPHVAPLSVGTPLPCSPALFCSSWRNRANLCLLFVLFSSSPVHLLRECFALKVFNN